MVDNTIKLQAVFVLLIVRAALVSIKGPGRIWRNDRLKCVMADYAWSLWVVDGEWHD